MSETTQDNSLVGNGWVTTITGSVTATVKCDSWNGFNDFLNSDKALRLNNGYYFRGHASENWELKPTLQREIESSTPTSDKNPENAILEEFKKFCLGRRGHNPATLSENEWWALGQHFGLKTPLLDWTESPYVAAYFAFNSEEHDTDHAVIWVLAKNINQFPGVSKWKQQHHLQFLTPYLDENSRLLNQRGLFVRSPEMQCIEDWVQTTLKEPHPKIGLTKVLIPTSEKRYVLDSLDKMNINHLTLFPDISGAAAYANYKFQEHLIQLTDQQQKLQSNN